MLPLPPQIREVGPGTIALRSCGGVHSPARIARRLELDEEVFSATVFTKNRERLLTGGHLAFRASTATDGCFGTVRTGWMAQFRAPKGPKGPDSGR